MTQTAIQLNDVVFNAIDQSFDALVTVGKGDHAKKYACAIEAPISMSFEQAAEGLKTQALRRHSARSGMYSQTRRHTPASRAGRATFDPRNWLAQLGLVSMRDAA